MAGLTASTRRGRAWGVPAAVLLALPWLACDESGTRVCAVAPVPAACVPSGPVALGVQRCGTPAKLYQLLGELDRQYDPPQATCLQTESRLGIVGADLGFSFLHQGRLYFYFCDVDTPDMEPTRPRDADAIAYVDVGSLRPDQPLDLKFLLDPDGRWHAITLDGLPQGSDRGPDSGFSDGEHLWVFYYVDPHQGGGQGYARLARSDDGGFSFTTVLAVPKHMEFVMPRVMSTADVPGLSALWSDPRRW